MLYNLEYLPVARRDILEIAKYISHKLENPMAAERLVTALIEKGERLRDMPYLNPVYTPIRPLSYEYRKAKVNNYLMFYRVDEQEKTIIIMRVMYSKRDYEEGLD